jgi:poly(hydroxyalkanoate) depolymerase family esterase
MNDDFMAAMRQTLDAVRAGNPAKATRLIQGALAGTGAPAAQAPAQKPDRPAGAARRPSRPLSQVLADLAARAPGQAANLRGPVRAPDLPEGAVFESRRHDGPHGARDYRLFRPSGRKGPIRGVVMMLHGCTQTPEDFAAGTGMNRHAEDNGLIVVYPEQTRGDNMQLCWNWFRPGDQRREGGEAALLAGLAAAVVAEHDLDDAGLFVGGLSAGGAMAALLANTHPDLVTAAAVHSGLAPGSAQDVVSAFAAMRGDAAGPAEALTVPAIIFHGSADGTVAPVNAGRLAGPLTAAAERTGTGASRRYDVLSGLNASGHPVEVWRIDGAGHAWSGGKAEGSYTDPAGPDASAEMVRFFVDILDQKTD